MKQFVYVNGYLDVSRSPAGPYEGTIGLVAFKQKLILIQCKYLYFVLVH
jgi:hypothetical protein